VRALPDARAEHADIAANGNHVAIVWRSSNGMETNLYAWLSTDGGTSFEKTTLAATQGDNDQPHLVSNAQHTLVVWRTQNGVDVHEITF